MRRVLSTILFALAASANAQQKSVSIALEKFSGIYELARGRLLYVQPWPGGDGKLLVTDEAGQLRALSSVSGNSFTSGPGLLQSAPIEQTIEFVGNSKGEIVRLVRRKTGGGSERARKLESYRREEVSFRNGDILLAGALWTPPGKGPHPAMVLIHGTGRTDRNNVLPIAHFLVTHGIALLGYDKRGVGSSSGDWQTASIEDLAGDAVAAAKFLASRKEIDSKKIGVFGVSHGGWVAPLAAAQSKDIAFVASVSGPGMSPADVELERLAHDLRARGFSEIAVGDAVELVRLANDVARAKQPWERYQPALEKAKKSDWFRYTSVPLTADSWLFDHWRHTPLDYDPAPAIAKLRVPVLALFGELDQNVIPAKNAERWKAALEEGGNRDYTIQIFPHANHMLLEARIGSEEEISLLQRFVPQLAPSLVDWLRKRGFAVR